VTQVFLGIGSNIEPEANLELAVAELRRRFGSLTLSRVYRGPAIGFEGPDFLNLVARAETRHSPRWILSEIESIHRLARRERDGDRFRSRTLDIDLLLYDGLITCEPGAELPRPDVLRYAFVLRPLAELAPDFVHPVTGRTLAEHWRELAPSAPRLVPVELDLDRARAVTSRGCDRRPPR
jgi:2-amino-4-hydroxy-6-hydroxymethyldihydropteridine diphosphokinase